MSASLTYLKENCNPARWARPSDQDWVEFESAIKQPVPEDFRSIVDFVGSGMFGFLGLFEPTPVVDDNEVAIFDCLRYHKWIYENSLFSDTKLESHWAFPSPEAAILGDLNRDEYLYWKNQGSQKGWFLIDTESFESRPIGEDLITSLVKSYTDYISGYYEPEEVYWESWSGQPSFSPNPMFTPVIRPQHRNSKSSR